MVMLVWGIVATAYLIIVPLVWEFVQTCRQAYYNRQWSKAEHTERFTGGVYEEPDPAPESDYTHDEKPVFDSVSNKSSDIHSTIGMSGLCLGSFTVFDVHFSHTLCWPIYTKSKPFILFYDVNI